MNEACHTGGCLCGAVRYQVSGAARDMCYCHCVSCRRAAGAPMVPWGTFARVGFRITHGSLALYRSSAHVTRGFCAACGTSLTYQSDAHAQDIDVTLATLDEAAQFAPQTHVWVSDKLPWVAIGDACPQYPGSRAGDPA
jgi:hypothetical protein